MLILFTLIFTNGDKTKKKTLNYTKDEMCKKKNPKNT